MKIIPQKYKNGWICRLTENGKDEISTEDFLKEYPEGTQTRDGACFALGILLTIKTSRENIK